MGQLTPKLLNILYSQEGRIESSIAKEFGLSQVQVGRLRKKWGIPTMTKGERISLSLPSVTTQQWELFIGSLLGDGSMSQTSELSARFMEGHSLKQEEYLNWKHHILKPFSKKIFNIQKRENGKIHRGKGFVTSSCTKLRIFYDMFYPAPLRKKIFPRNLPALMTPLVLAIWYMDDGSITSKGKPRIHFGLDKVSEDRAVAALKKLGLKPCLYGIEGGDRTFHFPGQAMKFKSLVEPYIQEVVCLQYKIPTETKRQQGDRQAKALTPERALVLYDAGMSITMIANVYGVGTSTVRRRIGSENLRFSGPVVLKHSLSEANMILECFSPEDWSTFSEVEQDQLVADIMKILRNTPFPIEPSKEYPMTVVSKLSNTFFYLENGDVIRPKNHIGTSFCASLFPNRYRASSKGGPTAFESWYDDKQLEWAVRFQLRSGDPVLPYRVLKSITMRCRTPTVFRPSVAAFMCRRYLPKGGVWWDPCAGYGGRLLGASSVPGVQYIGTDVDPETVKGNLKLKSVLGYVNSEVIEKPAEKFDPPPCDMVFTSPPYFDRERYSTGEDQSWVKYNTFSKWCSEFLVPIMRTAFEKLNEGGVFALNVADIRKNGEVVPIEKAVKTLAVEVGFELLETLKMPLAAMNRKNPTEPIFVFKKSLNLGGSKDSYYIDRGCKGLEKPEGKGLSDLGEKPDEPEQVLGFLPSLGICSVCGKTFPTMELRNGNCPSCLVKGVEIAVCKGCGKEFVRKNKLHEFHSANCRARYDRKEWRKTHPVKEIRIFTCKVCGVSFETSLLGNFTICNTCKENKDIANRTRICKYRECQMSFVDTSSKNGMNYCCEEHRRREKLFRSGKLSSVSQFRKPDPINP